ncbi:hypothetical protein T11_10169 [Trichinella zimbabwensis]|uniref:Uncharacterized protein n=1 Tax=Trichinella zimbabwensis TaxID=268475 RepID=A0A0V1GMJ1_9BILA|nr:hypothetical protein T11_10169 [Trichinella zimbabwensis]
MNSKHKTTVFKRHRLKKLAHCSEHRLSSHVDRCPNEG